MANLQEAFQNLKAKWFQKMLGPLLEEATKLNNELKAFEEREYKQFSQENFWQTVHDVAKEHKKLEHKLNKNKIKQKEIEPWWMVILESGNCVLGNEDCEIGERFDDFDTFLDEQQDCNIKLEIETVVVKFDIIYTLGGYKWRDITEWEVEDDFVTLEEWPKAWSDAKKQELEIHDLRGYNPKENVNSDLISTENANIDDGMGGGRDHYTCETRLIRAVYCNSSNKRQKI